MRTFVRALVLVVATAALIPVAAQAQNDRNRLIVGLQLKSGRHNFESDLIRNCSSVSSHPTPIEGRPQFTTADGVAVVGSLDFAQSRGEGFVKGDGWQIDPLSTTTVRSTLFTDMGVSLHGSTVYVTARVTRGRSLSAAARRERLAIVRGAKRSDGPLLDAKGKPTPNTFSFKARGKLKMLPAMSRALERMRCKNRRKNPGSRRLKPGYELGTLTVNMGPDHASGLGGDVLIKPVVAARGANGDQPVAVEPTAGISQDSDHNLVAPITAGTPVALTCDAGTECLPSGGSFAVGGGFDLVLGDRRASVGNIGATTTGTAEDGPERSIAGTLGGAPVAIADGGALGPGSALTDDFTRRAGDALGAPIRGSLEWQPVFTRTGP